MGWRNRTNAREWLGEREAFFYKSAIRTILQTKAALAHVQFEIINLFLDDNGRVGRLLGAQPILSLSITGEELKSSVPTVTASLKHLAKPDIAREAAGRNYGCNSPTITMATFLMKALGH